MKQFLKELILTAFIVLFWLIIISVLSIINNVDYEGIFLKVLLVIVCAQQANIFLGGKK